MLQVLCDFVQLLNTMTNCFEVSKNSHNIWKNGLLKIYKNLKRYECHENAVCSYVRAVIAP